MIKREPMTEQQFAEAVPEYSDFVEGLPFHNWDAADDEDIWCRGHGPYSCFNLHSIDSFLLGIRGKTAIQVGVSDDHIALLSGIDVVAERPVPATWKEAVHWCRMVYALRVGGGV